MLTKATGQQGAVTFGTVPAATLRSWTLEARPGEPTTWTLTGTVVNVNRFYMTQSPLSRQFAGRVSQLALEGCGAGGC